MPEARRIAIVGAGRVGSGLLRLVPPQWSVTLVDVDARQLASVAPERDIVRVAGDASSALVLGRCGLGPAVTLVLATGDDAVNREAARIARAQYGVQDVVAVLEGDRNGLEGEVVARADAVVGLLRRRIGGLRGGSSEGTGRGELLQVPVLGGSPAIGRRLRDLHRGDWLVAMIYRGEALEVPHGDTELAEGDRVLLAGEPSELEAIATFFRGGLPTFPAAWGTSVAFAEPAGESAAKWLAGRTTATSVVQLPPALIDPSLTRPEALAERVLAQDVGCLVVVARPVSWAARVGLVASRWPVHLRAADVPVLVVRGAAAPERVLVALGHEHEARVIAGAGIDLARQAGIPLALLTVLPPEVSPDAATAAAEVRDAVRYARLHGIEPQRLLERGNPIERIRAVARPSDLLVVGHAAARRNTVFTPDVSLFLLHDAPGPTLFVPWTRAA